MKSLLPTAFMPFLVLVVIGLGFGNGKIELSKTFVDDTVKVINNSFMNSYCEGPAYHPESGNVYFTDQKHMAKRVMKRTPSGQTDQFTAIGSDWNGIEVDPQGRLVMAQKNQIVSYSEAGDSKVLAEGNDLAWTNDLTIASTGAMFFTNFAGGSIYYLGPDGGTPVKVAQGLPEPNGVYWVEEKNLLYVALSHKNGGDKVVTYTVATDGKLSNRKDFASIPTPDGFAMDSLRNLYVGSYGLGQVVVYTELGQKLGSITINTILAGDNSFSANVSNCTFGGPNNKTLYITGQGGLFSVRMNVPGRKRPGIDPEPEPVSLARAAWGGSRVLTSQSVFSPLNSLLKLSLPDNGGKHLKVSIYDMSLRQVAEWTPGLGQTSLTWDGRDSRRQMVPSGRYVLVLKNGVQALGTQSISLIRP